VITIPRPIEAPYEWLPLLLDKFGHTVRSGVYQTALEKWHPLAEQGRAEARFNNQGQRAALAQKAPVQDVHAIGLWQGNCLLLIFQVVLSGQQIRPGHTG